MTALETATEIFLNLKEHAELVELLQKAERGLGPEKPAETLRRLLQERETLIVILRKSGAVKHVGPDIHRHLEWMTRRYLKPIRWPGNTEEKP